MQPVLQFAIMRFQYDFQTDSRKKKNFVISFPRVLDMSPYVIRGDGQADSDNTNIYELQGILRHKGTSAYQGHYEAQVYDAEWVLLFVALNSTIKLVPRHGGWLLFNDETYTEVQPVASRPPKTVKKTPLRNDMDVDVVGYVDYSWCTPSYLHIH